MNTNPQTEPSPKKICCSWHTKLILALLLIIIAAAITAKILWPSSSLTTDTQGNQASIQTLQNTVDQLQNQLHEQQTTIQKLQATSQETSPKKLTSEENWKQLEIKSLIHKADLILATHGDPNTAQKLLQQAKQTAANLSLIELEQALTKDIATLETTPTLDLENLVLKLDAISNQISNLSFIPKEAPKAIAPKPTDQMPYQTARQRLLTSVSQALKDLLIIRTQEIQPLPTAEQATMLRINIQTKLLQAELAAMLRQNQLYQACLAQAITWISQYFILNSSATSNILKVLHELQQNNVDPKLPTLDASLTAIKSLDSSGTSSATPISLPPLAPSSVVSSGGTP